MSVNLYKLSSGEEIIATVVESTPDRIQIKDSVVLVYQPADGGRMSVGFAPYMPYSQGTITLYAGSIISESAVRDQLLQEYNRTFSKIVIAAANSI